MALAERLTFPVFLRQPRPRTRLPDLSSLGVRTSYTVFLTALSRPLGRDAFLGVSAPSALEVKRVHGWFVTSAPVARGRQQFPPAGFGVAHRFSQPPSDFFLSPPPRHFQTGGAPGICPSRVCSSHEASTIRHRRPALMALLPRFAHASFLGGSNLGRAARCLGYLALAPFEPSGLSSSWESICITQTVKFR